MMCALPNHTNGFYEVAQLSWLMERFGPVTSRTERAFLRFQGLSSSEFGRILADAQSLGFVEAHGASWQLTSRGRTLGLQMRSAMEEIAPHARKPYRPFDGYLPSDRTMTA